MPRFPAANFALALLISSAVHAATPLLPLSSDAACNRCGGYLLPGHHAPSPHATWRIDSDLPELYLTNGVLYATTPVLPLFETKKDGPVPVEMRTQRAADGFTAIDGSFEVFLYHLSQGHVPGEKRRIVVYTENSGEASVTIAPRQALFHGPNSARPGGVESRLGEAVLAEEWDTPIAPVSVAAGSGAIIGYTKQLGASAESGDTTKAVFVTGTLRADVTTTADARPVLNVYVVSIPGSDDIATIADATRAILTTGAASGETSMDLRITPPQCHVRRVVGVARNVIWQSDPLELDVAALPEDRLRFPMALPRVQSIGCEAARQTTDLALHPPYVQPDSIGNYMMEYHVAMTLTNGGNAPRSVDLRFGKKDQKVGLAHQTIVGPDAKSPDELAALPVAITWAGKGSDGVAEPDFDTTLLPDGAFELPPGEARIISARLMVLGTSSLPYDLWLVSIPVDGRN